MKNNPSEDEAEEEEEYLSKSHMTGGSQDGKEEDTNEVDIYDSLKLAPDQPKGGFKYNPEEQSYYLQSGFSLPKDVYENLFEH